METQAGRHAVDLRRGVFHAGIDLRQLGVLLAIAETGSLAAAARHLDVAQPTITHHLDALESRVGGQLVRRGPRGADLTDLGWLLLPQAESVLDRLASAITEVRGRAHDGLVTMRVGTFSSAGGRLLPAAVGEVRQRTDVRIELHEAETIDLLADLAAGTLHVALVYNDSPEPLEVPEPWVRTLLGWDRYLLAIPAQHRLAASSVALADFADEGWILSHQADPSADRALLSAAGAAGFTPRPVLRTDDFHVALGFVAAGLGVTVVPQLALESRPGVQYAEITDGNLGRTLEVVHPAAMPTAIQILVERLRADAPAILGTS